MKKGNTTPIILDVYRIVGGKKAYSHNHAIRVNNHCTISVAKKQSITLDFADVEIVTCGFWATSVGTLFDNFKGDTIRKYVKVRNLSDENKQVLGDMLVAAKEFYNYKNTG
ncbi:MAG TPA: DUF4325 domain-containing protein [Candidatus Cloacimonetes bacterium]|nr:DUF4325 domain-containing protein [Candidatus Cloacimonadota bacterium]